MDPQINPGYILLNKDEPQSLYHLIPEYTFNLFLKIPDKFLQMDARTLRTHVKPGLTLEAMRTSFWVEYNYAVSENRKMVVKRIHAGICSEDYFYKNVLVTPLFLAWLLQPPEDYTKAMQALLVRSTERIYELLDTPFVKTDDNGKVTVDHKVMSLVLQAHKHLEERVKGSVVQRIEQKSLNVNVNRDVLEVSEDELDRRLRELRTRERKALGQGRYAESGGEESFPIDVGSRVPSSGEESEREATGNSEA